MRTIMTFLTVLAITVATYASAKDKCDCALPTDHPHQFKCVIHESEYQSWLSGEFVETVYFNEHLCYIPASTIIKHINRAIQKHGLYQYCLHEYDPDRCNH